MRQVSILGPYDGGVDLFLRIVALGASAVWVHIMLVVSSFALSFLVKLATPEPPVLYEIEIERPVAAIEPEEPAHAGSAGRRADEKETAPGKDEGSTGDVATLEVFRIQNEPIRPLTTPRMRDHEEEEAEKAAAMSAELSAGLLAVLGASNEGAAATSLFGSDRGIADVLSAGDGIGSVEGVGGLAAGGRSTGDGGLRGGGGAGLGRIGTAHAGGRGAGELSSIAPASSSSPGSSPVVRFSGISVSGNIASSDASRVLRRSQPRFRRCYAQALESNPSLEGKLRLALIVDSSGEVSSVRLGESDPKRRIEEVADTALESCLEGVARLLVFPVTEGDGGQVVAVLRFVED